MFEGYRKDDFAPIDERREDDAPSIYLELPSAVDPVERRARPRAPGRPRRGRSGGAVPTPQAERHQGAREQHDRAGKGRDGEVVDRAGARQPEGDRADAVGVGQSGEVEDAKATGAAAGRVVHDAAQVAGDGQARAVLDVEQVDGDEIDRFEEGEDEGAAVGGGVRARRSGLLDDQRVAEPGAGEPVAGLQVGLGAADLVGG